MRLRIIFASVAMGCGLAIAIWWGWSGNPTRPAPSASSLKRSSHDGVTDHAVWQGPGSEDSTPSRRPGSSTTDAKHTSGRDIISQGGLADWEAFVKASEGTQERERFLERVGESGRPEASGFLRGCLALEDPVLRRAAIRGLAMTGVVADAELLGRLIFATNLSIEETTEAALALGKTSAAVASGILIQSYPKAGNEELAQCILMGLAERPFHQTQTFFRDMLANPAEQATRKKDVLEALGQMDTVRDQFFVPYLESTDAEIRRGAYLGIGKLTESSLGHRLLLCLQKETDSMARADLYEALSLKDSGNPVLLSQLAVSEKEMDTRLIAAKALAKSLQGTPAGDPSTVAFEKNWIPELTRVVLGASRSQSAQAFAALLMCRESPSTREAFSKIAQESTSATIREMALKSLD